MRVPAPAHLGGAAPVVAGNDTSCLPWVKVTRDAGAYEACVAAWARKGPIQNAAKVYELLHERLAKEDQEVFLVVILDVRGNLRGVAEVARGQRSRVAVGVTDVMRVVRACHIMDLVLLAGGEAFLVVHNHPTGNPSPSKADVELYRTVKDAAAPYGSELTFLDHVVIGLGHYHSIREHKGYSARSAA